MKRRPNFVLGWWEGFPVLRRWLWQLHLHSPRHLEGCEAHWLSAVLF